MALLLLMLLFVDDCPITKKSESFTSMTGVTLISELEESYLIISLEF
jgi:hypothetical protein